MKSSSVERGSTRVVLACVVAAALVTAALLAGAAGGTAGGALDGSFGTGGKVVTDLGGDDRAMDVAVQQDGKLVVVGRTETLAGGQVLSYGFAVARYTPQGRPDVSFGGSGRVITADGLVGANAVAQQSDGRIVAGGYGSPGQGMDFALARYTPDGSLDRSFGGDGLVFTDFGGTFDAVGSVVLQPDGKIVAAGFASSDLNRQDFAVARYNADGTIDRSFGADGKVTTNLDDLDGTAAAAIQSDGRIVLAGFSEPADAGGKVALLRYNGNGSLDSSFGGQGRVIDDLPSPNETAAGIAIQPDGKILVGAFGSGDLAALRYTPSGMRDATFGTDGLATVSGPAAELPFDLALQANGKILIFGHSFDTPGQADFALARLLPNGAADKQFGQAGLVRTDLGANDIASAVSLQPGGGIVAVGSSWNGFPNIDFLVSRFLPGACSVPKLRAKTVAAARSLLASGNCQLGIVRQAKSKLVKKGRVISQSSPAGTEAEDWALVNLVISRGRK